MKKRKKRVDQKPRDETSSRLKKGKKSGQTKGGIQHPIVEAETQGDQSHWFARWCEAHNFCAEQYVFPRKGVTEADILDFAAKGDVIAQYYLSSLRKAVPNSAEAGTYPTSNYFERLLLAHIRRLNGMLCDLARAGRREACKELWDEALRLTETFLEVALIRPTAFESKARRSLFMPSIRTTNPGYSADAEAIAKAIELSKDTVGDQLTDNRVRLGMYCAVLVARCVDEIVRTRREWSNQFLRRQLPVIWPTMEQVQTFQGRSTGSIIGGLKMEVPGSADGQPDLESRLSFICLSSDCGSERVHFLTLPELTRETASIWWKQAIEKMVEEQFPKLMEKPVWVEMLKGVSRGTRADLLKELKDYTREKVKQFAAAESRP